MNEEQKDKDPAPREAKKEDGPSRGIQELEAYAAGNTEAIEQALKRLLSAPITDRTFEALRDATILLIGEEGFRFLVWVASRAEPRPALEAFDLSSRLEGWLKALIATYGSDIRKALHSSDVPASRRDDWESFGSSVRIDPKTGDYEITTEILKFDGTKLLIRAGLPSAVRLASEAVSTVLKVPSLQSVEEEDREELLAAAKGVYERLLSEKADDGAEKEEDAQNE